MAVSIKAENLIKNYGLNRVVDEVSFIAEQGDVVGFLGPNGAGKTTTMRMLTGFLVPDSGSVHLSEENLHLNPLIAKSKIGYLPEGAPLYSDMTVLKFLRFVGSIRAIKKPQLNDQIDTVIQKIQLSSVLDRRIDDLSKGYKRRVGIAQAILHDPEILIMDEPTDGLDPSQKIEVRQLIKNMAKDKVIVLSTHILEEVEAVCNRVMIIAGGKLLADKPPAQLLENHQNSLELAFLNLTKGHQTRT